MNSVILKNKRSSNSMRANIVVKPRLKDMTWSRNYPQWKDYSLYRWELLSRPKFVSAAERALIPPTIIPKLYLLVKNSTTG